MKNSFKKTIASLVAAAVMATTMGCIGASAAVYQQDTDTTTGGSGGKIEVTAWVFKTTTRPPTGGVTIYSSGIKGIIKNNDEDLLFTDWRAYGNLYRPTTTTPIDQSFASQPSVTASKGGTGYTYDYTTYALRLRTTSSAFGSSYYEANGTF